MSELLYFEDSKEDIAMKKMALQESKRQLEEKKREDELIAEGTYLKKLS